MKKIFLATIVAMAMYGQSSAQTTNTFPASGNAGIGTTSPSESLSIEGGPAHGKIFIATPFADAILKMYRWSGTGSVYFPWYIGIGPADGSGSFSIMNGSPTYVGSEGMGEVFHISGNGNTGIGVSNPLSLFQVEDGVSKASIGSAGDSQVLNWGTSYLGFNASRIGSGSNCSWLTNGDNNNNGGGVIYSSVFGDMYFATVPTTGATGQTLFDADIAGHIALKISHTDGAVYAKQVYVQTSGFPDYVFKKDYKLMPLAQVKSYIDQNHHLPDMPAAAVVEKDGINLGEMNKLLTKKVEELTLYLIEKDGRDKEKETQLRSQQQQIDQLKQQIVILMKASNKN
ncbi:hypothetical protein ACFGVR_15375 [Mucilaginibacter sp. AW1-3]